MQPQFKLFCPPQTDSGLFFVKIAGVPLLLRNILALSKSGAQSIAVILPTALVNRYLQEIEPALEKKKISVTVTTYDRQLPHCPSAIPAHALVETKKPNLKWEFLVDAPHKIQEAQKRLTETIRLSTPGPVAKYFNKRISLRISLILSKINIHPNWITLCNMILGISSGFFVAMGTYTSLLIGATLFQLASIFDGCDGEIAKLTFKTSKFGQYFDSLSDNGALISFFIGLIAAFAKIHDTSLTLGMGIFLMVGLAGLLWQMIFFLKRNTQSASLATFDKEYLSKLNEADAPKGVIRFIQIGKILMRKDFFSMAFFVMALIGHLSWALYSAIAGLWVANGLLIYLKAAPQPFPKTIQE